MPLRADLEKFPLTVKVKTGPLLEIYSTPINLADAGARGAAATPTRAANKDNTRNSLER
jgi:hypothetical protein